MDEELFDKSIESRIASMEHADTWHLCADIREEIKAVKIITNGRFHSLQWEA